MKGALAFPASAADLWRECFVPAVERGRAAVYAGGSDDSVSEVGKRHLCHVDADGFGIERHAIDGDSGERVVDVVDVSVRALSLVRMDMDAGELGLLCGPEDRLVRSPDADPAGVVFLAKLQRLRRGRQLTSRPHHRRGARGGIADGGLIVTEVLAAGGAEVIPMRMHAEPVLV